MHPDEVWLRSSWPFISKHLPPAPAAVLEVGCGEFGGHVPALLTGGYAAVGVDPEAPEGPAYRNVPVEEYAAARPVDAVVASLSLHHVADPAAVLDQVRDALAPDGVVIVVEWASEAFDEATARWCFDRLRPDVAEEDADWLDRRHAEWVESGLPWDAYCRGWASEHGLHETTTIISELDARFDMIHSSSGPYYFAGLATTEEAERAAIDAGEIRPGCRRYVGRLSGAR